MNLATNTKESRLNSRAYQFNKLIEAGYLQETYKEVDFFTKEEGKYFTLKVFHGTAANHTEHVNYRTAERRAEVIQNYKNNYDSRQQYKAEQKIKNKGKLSQHAAASAAIKAELTSLYPHIKFSVKSESFSMGDSVRVNWTDGPTSDEVDNIIKKYQYGHFDGMNDIYESSNRRNDIPQSKYVSSSRSISDEIEAILLPDAERLFNADHYRDVRSAKDFLRRIFYNCSIQAGATVTGIVPTGETCGISCPETFYKIGYTLPETATEQQQPNFTPVEVVKGEVNIVDYSEKAFAVIGTPEDLKALQPKMYELGGKYNKYLKCGAGYIFSKKKLDEVTKALSEETAPKPTQSATIEEAKSGIKDEVKKIIELFADIDIKNNGVISEGTKQAAAVQNVPLIYAETTPKYYNNLQDIEEAAQGGKVISLFNLSQLINNV